MGQNIVQENGKTLDKIIKVQYIRILTLYHLAQFLNQMSDTIHFLHSDSYTIAKLEESLANKDKIDSSNSYSSLPVSNHKQWLSVHSMVIDRHLP